MPLHTPPPLPDWPTFKDEIGWKDQLSALATRVAHCETPQVFGVHGDWGAGKSSFARQLQHNLGAKTDPSCDAHRISLPIDIEATKRYKSKIVTVWFEAWRYQHEPVPVVALLHEIRRQFEFSDQAKQRIKKLGAVTFRVMLNTLSDIGKRIGVEALPSGEKISAVGEQWEREHYAQRLGTDSIAMLLQGAIDTLLPMDDGKSDGIRPRVVVFIDDLDRCHPDAAFKLLEGIKVYLNIPKCVFVIAMNETAMQEAVAKNLPSLDKAELPPALRLRAAHYLEKLCTNIYRLPEPAKPHDLFLSYLPDENQRSAIKELLGLLDLVYDTSTLPPNPRRLKALANQWRRLAAIHWDSAKPMQERRDQAALLLVVAYIYQFHSAIWQLWRFDHDFWNVIEAWTRGEKPNDEAWQECFKPLALPPGVTREDQSARTYVDPSQANIFWIASLIRTNSDLFNARQFAPYLQQA